MIFKVHSFHESNRNDEKICPRWKITRDKVFCESFDKNKRRNPHFERTVMSARGNVCARYSSASNKYQIVCFRFLEMLS